MKGLSIEEKAKRYDEAKYIMKEYLESGNAGVIAENTIKKAFPELAESEDERIRKALIRYFTLSDEHAYNEACGVSYRDIIAWLEKKGQKPEKVSIWKHWKNGIAGNGEGKLIYLVKSGGTYRLTSSLTFECDYIELSKLDKLMQEEKQGKQKPTDKVEPKFKVGDVVTNKKSKDTVKIVQILHDSYCYSGWDGAATVHSDFSISEQDDWELVKQKLAWSEEDRDYYDAIIAKLEVTQDDALLTDNQMEFLKSLKDRCQPQPKQEWSEEDESMRTRCIGILGKCYMGELPTKVEEELNWLKSLRPQST